MGEHGWAPAIGEFPYPPQNGQVVSPMITGIMDIRWDDPSILATGKTDPLVQACATVIVTSGTPPTGVAASSFVQVLSFPVPADTTITIGGIVLTAVNGPRTAGANDFNGLQGSADAIAADINAALSDAANSFSDFVTPSLSGNTVTITSNQIGIVGNEITLATNNPTYINKPLETTLFGGVDTTTLTIGDNFVLQAVVGPPTSGNLEFSVDGNSFDIAQSISDAINDPANGLSGLVNASALNGQVTILATQGGSSGNFISIDTNEPSYLVLSGDHLVGGSGTEGCEGISNTTWNIVGVNVYRSDTGERGPYFRLNDTPVGGLFFRDYTDNILISEELVADDQWLSKGDTSNDSRWVFRTTRCPIVKNKGQAIHANSPTDVKVFIDGVQVPIEGVFGPTGQVTLINQPTYDISTEKFIPPVLPRTDENGTVISTVSITYYINKNLVKSDLETKAKVFYRLTTVALDPSTPSGYAETPLGWTPPLNVHQVESYDYIWREAVRRNTWILQQGGERVKLFIRRVSGVPCPCRVSERIIEYMAQPLNQNRVDSRCSTCFGTGWIHGYEGPIDIILAPDDAERRISQGDTGRRLEHVSDVWTGPSPMLSQRDFIVKQTGERYSIGPVRRPSSRGLPLQQHFNIGYLDEADVRYKVPVYGVTELPWPQTRTTDERTVCNDADPYPVGFDYQATPMETEKDNIPDEREQRGRTPVWSNITY